MITINVIEYANGFVVEILKNNKVYFTKTLDDDIDVQEWLKWVKALYHAVDLKVNDIIFKQAN